MRMYGGSCRNKPSDNINCANSNQFIHGAAEGFLCCHQKEDRVSTQTCHVVIVLLLKKNTALSPQNKYFIKPTCLCRWCNNINDDDIDPLCQSEGFFFMTSCCMKVTHEYKKKSDERIQNVRETRGKQTLGGKTQGNMLECYIRTWGIYLDSCGLALGTCVRCDVTRKSEASADRPLCLGLNLPSFG
ncbi:hypothetical protein JOB18_048681 [Solea senegalensis]|uniref:Uncharacterized protein n=1 Tax=Solea senegalensis TaxID=28829 RepID=A0AAV6R9Y8_SOLSE|nr:hypothetical protein JOB18_048681 [Solea senegalensis]